ncbi:zf-TFIIB domain-containing protein [Arenicella xantha]|uniref:Transcription factor zinc-finger domain-containing protein n=1 Tax=Arenicella xantha TaxID=644221 RepID=A0A395JQL2_9GAMM|nr:hypothetical protein [Arenicella xantha]RBP51010.1 hypothetical protein DFR28_102427 [Arenicella xantha]
MKCTACESGLLIPAYLEGLFPCHTCTDCGGNLVMLGDYLRWQDANENALFISDTSTKVEIQETERALLCPKTGRLMTKYRIAKETEHRLDLSPHINAVWLDKGEWALLKEQGLAGRLNEIFTDHWQSDVRSKESADILDGLYAKRFGEHYADIKAFRAKIDKMDERSEVIAYLLADDPYKP